MFYNTLNPKNQQSYSLDIPIVRNLKINIASSYFIKGVPDSGKTTLALQIAKAWIDETQMSDKIHFISSLKITELLRTWYNNKSSSQDSDKWKYEYESYRDSLCLIIDDFGKEKVTEFVFEKWYELLNYRNENGLQTIFTSNESLETIAKNFDDSVRSRIFAIIGNPETNVIQLQYQGHRTKTGGNQTDFNQFKKELPNSVQIRIEKNKENILIAKEQAIKFMFKGYINARQDNNSDWILTKEDERKQSRYFKFLTNNFL